MNRPTRTTIGVTATAAICALSGIFAVGSLGDATTPRDDRILIATFGAGMGLFGLMLALLATQNRRAWWALWYLPLFLALHIALLHTWLPDGVLLVVSAAALLLLAPDGRSSKAVMSPV